MEAHPQKNKIKKLAIAIYYTPPYPIFQIGVNSVGRQGETEHCTWKKIETVKTKSLLQ